jgi:hypothetical protein
MGYAAPMKRLGSDARLSSLALLLAVSACGSRDDTIIGGAGTGAEAATNTNTAPAVMVAVANRSPEGTNFYVGAYPELPAEVDLSGMLETPSGQNAAAFNGSIYVWSPDSGIYTRYAVDDQMRLSQSGAVSFVNLGGTGNVMTQFISPTRAYSMTRDNLQIIVWNPESMTISGEIDTSAALDPNYAEFDYGEPVVFGDYVAWPILWYSYDDFDFKPSVDVIFASSSSNEPAFAVSDSRCGGGWSLFTDDRGDLYALGNAWFGFAHFFDQDPSRQPNDCLLRIPLGSTTFDPDFYVDLNAAANTPAVYHTWQSAGRSVVAAVWDPAIDPTTLPSPDDYWTAPMQRKLVRIDDAVSEPLEGIPSSAVFSTLNYRLDGELYMLMSEGSSGPAGDARSTLYRVTESRAELAITTPGDLWAIGRIR